MILTSPSTHIPLVSVSHPDSGYCEFHIGKNKLGSHISYDSTAAVTEVYKIKSKITKGCINLSIYIKR